MKPHKPPDCLHLRAAQGWLELGDHLEANHELDKISPRLRMHPDVLLLCYEIFAKVKWWDAAFYVAQALVEIEPKEPCGWINQAFALRKMISGGAQAAWDALLPAADKFPKNPIISYNLACYGCQIGKLDDARDWLKVAMSLGVSDEFKLMALDEPDLKPLCLAIADI